MNDTALKLTPERAKEAGLVPLSETRGALTPMDMLNQAVTSGAGIEIMEKLMALHERWEANQSRKAFDAAVAAAKAEIPVIKKNKHVGFEHKNGDGATDYWHEDLGEIARTVDPILSQHGLSYRYRSAQADGRVTVTCILSHRDGFSEDTSLSASPDASGKKNSIQQVGSAITYLQRYTLKLALGLAAERDDDGGKVDQSDPISQAQRDQLLALIQAKGVDIQRFCAFLHIESLADLPSNRFEDARRALEAKKAKQ